MTVDSINELLAKEQQQFNGGENPLAIVCMCRRGNASQQAVLKLKELGFHQVVDIQGGISAMAQIDPSLASY